MAWGQKPWTAFLVLPFTSCVNFGKSYKQSEPPLFIRVLEMMPPVSQQCGEDQMNDMCVSANSIL